MIVRELTTRLGFDTDEKKVKSFEASIKRLTKGLAALVAGASAASAAAFKLASDTARYGDEVAKTSRLLGVGIEELQRYRFAFDRVGVSQEQTDAALKRFNVTLGQASQGMGKGAQVFNSLGVAVRSPNGELRSMSEIMPEVMTALRGINNESQRAAIAQELFGRNSAMLVANLKGGGDELRALGAEFDALGGGLSGPQALAAEAFTDAMTNMQAAFRGMRLQIGARLMPVFQEMIESFTQFLEVNRELILARIHRTFEILINVMRVLVNTLRMVWRTIDGLAQSIGGWEAILRVVAIALLSVFGAKMIVAIATLTKALMATGAILVALKVAAVKLFAVLMANPLVLIIALILLLVDELYNWMRGNETVIARIIGSWEDFKNRIFRIFRSIVQAARNLWSSLTDAFDRFIVSPIRRIPDLYNEAIERVKEMWSDLTEWIGDKISDAWAKSKESFDKFVIAPIQRIPELFDDAIQRIREMWSGLTQWMGERITSIMPKWLQRRLSGGTDADSGMAGDSFDFPDLSGLTPEMVASDMQSAGGGDIRNTTLNNRSNINITVPPGTTQEQLESIRQEIDQAMERQIDNAALALEVR